jgi:hypothetical protein
MPAERSHDLHPTSSFKAMDYRPPEYFPDTAFRATVSDPLPPSLQVSKPEMITPYETTTGSTHDRKYGGGVLADERFQRAAGNWKVDYVKDHVEKLENRRWRPELTMGNEESEMKARYKGATSTPGVDFQDVSRIAPQGFLLDNHHKDGPSKVGGGSSENPALAAQEFFVNDQGILRELDPYISTTQKDHRRFLPDEQRDGYARKNQATYWACDEYPKAWGHGPHQNPLPKGAVPRERPPMRDTMQFKHGTQIPFWPKSAKPVPNGSYKTEAQDKFTMPLEERMRDARICPVDPPYILQEPHADDLNLPSMYDTTNAFYGSEDKVTVTS